MLEPQQPDIDISFNVRSDAGKGDADTSSPTLRRYHQLLWSKELPCGVSFELSDATPGVYLHHQSELGEFFVTGDTVTTGFKSKAERMGFFDELPTGLYERHEVLLTTVGGRIVFPSNKIDRKMTINGARGCHPRVMDRFDLTLECIRRHYVGGKSPLSAVLARYSPFFSLFETFEGYVDFFLLQDAVLADYSAVRFHLPFTGFDVGPVPKDAVEHTEYLQSTIAFMERRNRRISISRRSRPN